MAARGWEEERRLIEQRIARLTAAGRKIPITLPDGSKALVSPGDPSVDRYRAGFIDPEVVRKQVQAARLQQRLHILESRNQFQRGTPEYEHYQRLLVGESGRLNPSPYWIAAPTDHGPYMPLGKAYLKSRGGLHSESQVSGIVDNTGHIVRTREVTNDPFMWRRQLHVPDESISSGFPDPESTLADAGLAWGEPIGPARHMTETVTVGGVEKVVWKPRPIDVQSSHIPSDESKAFLEQFWQKQGLLPEDFPSHGVPIFGGGHAADPFLAFEEWLSRNPQTSRASLKFESLMDEYLETTYSRFSALPGDSLKQVYDSAHGSIFQAAIEYKWRKAAAPLIEARNEHMSNRLRFAELQRSVLDMGGGDPALRDARIELRRLSEAATGLEARIDALKQGVSDVESVQRRVVRDKLDRFDVDPFMSYWAEEEKTSYGAAKGDLDVLRAEITSIESQRKAVLRTNQQGRTLAKAMAEGSLGIEAGPDGKLRFTEGGPTSFSRGQIGYIEKAVDFQDYIRDPNSGLIIHRSEFVKTKRHQAPPPLSDASRPGFLIRPIQGIQPEIGRQMDFVSTGFSAVTSPLSRTMSRLDPSFTRVKRTEVKVGTPDYAAEARATLDVKHALAITRAVNNVDVANVAVGLTAIPETYQEFLGMNDVKRVLSESDLAATGLSDIQISKALTALSFMGGITEEEAKRQAGPGGLLENILAAQNRTRRRLGQPEATLQDIIGDPELRGQIARRLPIGISQERKAIGLRVLRSGLDPTVLSGGGLDPFTLAKVLMEAGVSETGAFNTANNLLSLVQNAPDVSPQAMASELVTSLLYGDAPHLRGTPQAYAQANTILGEVLKSGDPFSVEVGRILKGLVGAKGPQSPKKLLESLSLWAKSNALPLSSYARESLITATASDLAKVGLTDHDYTVSLLQESIDLGEDDMYGPVAREYVEAPSSFDDYFGVDDLLGDKAPSETLSGKTRELMHLRVSALSELRGLPADVEKSLRSAIDLRFEKQEFRAGFTQASEGLTRFGLTEIDDVNEALRAGSLSLATDSRLPLFAGTPEMVLNRLSEAVANNEVFESIVPHPIDPELRVTLRRMFSGKPRLLSEGLGKKPSLFQFSISSEIVGTLSERIEAYLALHPEEVARLGGYTKAKEALTDLAAKGSPIGLAETDVFKWHPAGEFFGHTKASKEIATRQLIQYAERLGVETKGKRVPGRQTTIDAIRKQLQKLKTLADSGEVSVEEAERLARLAESLGGPTGVDNVGATIAHIDTRLNQMINRTVRSRKDVLALAKAQKIDVSGMSDVEIEAVIRDKQIEKLALEYRKRMGLGTEPEAVIASRAIATREIDRASVHGTEGLSDLGMYRVSSSRAMLDLQPAWRLQVNALEKAARAPALNLTAQRHDRDLNILTQMRRFASSREASHRTASIFDPFPLLVRQHADLASAIDKTTPHFDVAYDVLARSFAEAPEGPSLDMVRAVQEAFESQEDRFLFGGKENPIRDLFRRMDSQIAQSAAKKKLYGPAEFGLMMFRKGVKGERGKGAITMGEAFADLRMWAAFADADPDNELFGSVGEDAARQASALADDMRDVMRFHVSTMLESAEFFSRLQKPIQRALVTHAFGEGVEANTPFDHVNELIEQMMTERAEAAARPVGDPGDVPPPRPPPGAAGDAADEAATSGRDFYKRMTTDAVRDLFKLRAAKGGAIGLGVMAGIALFTKRKKPDYTEDDLRGPQYIPGGGAYEQTPPPEYNLPQYERGASSGVTYQVQARGEFDSRQLSAQITEVTGGGMQNSTYDVPLRADQARSREEEEIMSQYSSSAGVRR